MSKRIKTLKDFNDDFPKVEYKKGVLQMNTNNLFDLKDYEDAEEHLKIICRDIKNDQNRITRDKCSLLNTTLYHGLGSFITKEYFLKVLEYCGITFQEFVDYTIYRRSVDPFADKFDLRWFNQMQGDA